MTLVLRNMKRYRFRYDDANGVERVAVLHRGQSVAHLNLSEQSEWQLRHLVIGIGGEPHPVFIDDGVAVKEVNVAPVAPVEGPVAVVPVEEPAAAAPKTTAKKAAAKKPRPKAKKPTVSS